MSTSSFRSQTCYAQARRALMKRPSRVSICRTSPISMNIGTWMVTPVSMVAGLVEPWTVSPLKPGSVSVTSSSTNICGSSEMSSLGGVKQRSLVILLQPIGRGADGLGGNSHLLEGVVVHEVVIGAVVVEVLHLLRLKTNGVELGARVERVVNNAAVLMSRSLVRTKAPPLPGFTCWNSTMVHILPLLTMHMPFLKSAVEMVAMLAILPYRAMAVSP